MLKIIIELHPFGRAENKTTIAEMALWNTGDGDRDMGNYQGQAEIGDSPWNRKEIRGGRVLNHPRSAPVWNLVAKMLHQMGYGHTVTYNKTINDEQRTALADIAAARRGTET